MQAMKALLEEWFREDEKILRDISNGDISIENYQDAFIHPLTWDQIITHKMYIIFRPHSESEGEDSDTESGADYENRILYVLDYYKRGTNHWLDCTRHDKPVEFEFTYDSEKQPALEETKTIETTQHSKAMQNDTKNGENPKLGPLDRVAGTELQIHSPFIHNILKAIIEYTAAPLDGTSVGLGVFKHPYKDLYHHMANLENYKSGGSKLRTKHSEHFNGQCDEHIDLLLEYLYAQKSVPVKEFHARLAQKTPVVTFAMYWLLLKPGTDVYVREEDGSLNPYVVHTVEGGVSEQNDKNTSRNYTIVIWNLAFDGTHISPGTRYVHVSVFDNMRDVTSLPIFPVRFIDDLDGGVFKEKLVNRGRRYFEYCKRPSFLQYSGQGLKTGAKNVRLCSH